MRSATRLGSTGSKSNLTKRAGVKLTPLTIEEVRRLPKPYTGFEPFVDGLVGIVRDFPDDLGTNGINVAAVREDLANYAALAAPRAAAAQELAAIEDTRLLLHANAWAQVLVMYSRARAAARTNPEIKRALEAFERFMKHGPRVQAATPAAPTTPTTP